MRALLTVSSVFAVLCSAVIAVGAPPPEFDKYRDQYIDEMAKIEEAGTGGDASGSSDGGYADALKKLDADFRAEGDLDGVVATRREIERFSKEAGVRDADLVEKPEALRALQQKYIAGSSAPRVQRANKIVDLTQKYIKAMEAMQAQLVRSDRIDDALLVKEEIDRAQQDKAYVSAKEDATAEPPADKPPEDKPVAQPSSSAGPLAEPYRGRTEQGRKTAIMACDGTGSEAAVVKALEWLKTKQNEDGSWGEGNFKTAMAGLCLMCFAGHGETPSAGPYGDVVEKAVKYIISVQEKDGRFKECGNNYVYGHAMATYALADVYGMTKRADVKAVLDKAIAVIIAGQQPGGTWDYNYSKGPRKDMCVSSWQIQALKAAKYAGVANPGLDAALKASVAGIDGFLTPEGYYGYGGPTRDTVACDAAAILNLMVLSAPPKRTITKAFAMFEGIKCEWELGDRNNCTYAWYYVIQAMFHNGGPMWKKWNRQLLAILLKNQQADGHWFQGKTNDPTPIYDTALACLCLEVYYRWPQISQASGSLKSKFP